ncbi:cardiolipin synthase [Lichenibacterium minor]|uniref:cardiolipin synthase n=1 Tax=Lichenibacterium minor TaxID=2316528 RepID=UPI001FDF8046|nr:cardiolipin synthase [Lichenibacterium minor]
MLGPAATPVGLILAVGVTVHVLLHKREVAAATAWIGFAFIAPVWGALFYFMFGINRVVRRAQKARTARAPRRPPADQHPVHELPDPFAALERAVRRITNRKAERRNAVAVFHDGDACYPAMLDAIAGARSSIALSSYIMRDDGIGDRFARALLDAQNRGVAVRVLVDGIGSGYFSPIKRRLDRMGVPAAQFMHSVLPWRMPFLNLRSHKKLLVVDGTVGFTGGMNISDQNLVAQRPKHPVADTHFRFEGPVVTQLLDVFAHDWHFATDEDIEGERWFPDPDETEAGEILARVITSGPDQDLEKIRSVLMEACACAQHSVKVMTPYFLPGAETVSALTLAALRGVRVDIIVPQRSDHRFIDLAMRAHIAPLIEAGVRFWLGPAPFNHSKLMVVDKQWSLVGSSNWDMRSLRLNFEMNVEIYDEALALELDGFMTAHQKTKLKHRDLSARSLPVKLRDAALRLLLPYI